MSGTVLICSAIVFAALIGIWAITRGPMVIVIFAAAFFALGCILFAAKALQKQAAGNVLMGGVRSARAWLNKVKEDSSAAVEAVRTKAAQDYNMSKAAMEKEYEASKAAIEKEYEMSKAVVEKEYEASKAAMEKEHEAALKDAKQQSEREIADLKRNSAEFMREKDREKAEAEQQNEDRKNSLLADLKQKNESRRAELTADMTALLNALKETELNLDSELKNLGASDESDWTGTYSPATEAPPEIMFGFLEDPVSSLLLDASVDKKTGKRLTALDYFKFTPKTNCKACGKATCMAFSMDVAAVKIEIGKCPHIKLEDLEKLSEASAPLMKTIKVGAGKAEFTLPFTEPLDAPLKILIDYEVSQKDAVMAGVQAFIIKLLRFMPLFSYTVTYIDPNDRGSNLGVLQKLYEISSFDVCRKAYASKEDIQKRLKELEAFVDATVARLAAVNSVYEYTAGKNAPIIRHFVIINDYPDNFERLAQESLAVLLKNADKCGLSMIFTTGKGTTDWPQELTGWFKRVITMRNGKGEIRVDGTPYPFRFDTMPANAEVFIETFKTLCNEGVKIDNNFSTYFDISGAPRFDDSKEKMLLPFAVDSRRNLVELELGSPLTTNALLSGAIGSGKSTTLHILIMSIIMKYRPEDVQLWLVDYKQVEFAEYIENMPPHVKLVGLERSDEFTFSLLEKLDQELQDRRNTFKEAGVANITDFRRKGGKIPRILLIIDEFHLMTQVIQNESRFSTILENILSEGRAFGLSCVFSDQAISAGLRGLTEKGRMQIRTRIAMSNDLMEIRETLSLDQSFYTDEIKTKMNRLNVGDIMFKQLTADKSGEAQILLDKYRTIYITKEQRKAVIDWVKKHTGAATEKPIVVDGQHRKDFKPQVITEYERETGITVSGGKQIPLYVGTPANLNPCFCLFLREKIDANILVIGADEDLRASVVFWAMYSFSRQSKRKIYVFADKNDELYTYFESKSLLERLKQAGAVVFAAQAEDPAELGKICQVIAETQENLKPGNTRTLILWLGLETLAEEFAFQPEKSKPASAPRSAPAPASRVDALSKVDELGADIDALVKEKFGGGSLDSLIGEKTPAGSGSPGSSAPQTPVQTEGFAPYNAGGDIQDILAKGSRYGIFTLATFSSYKSLKETKFVKAESFDHKIAFNMSIDESNAYLGRGSYASGLDPLTAVYYDGSSVKTFRPYLLPKTE